MIPKFRVWDKHLKIMRNVQYIDFENQELKLYADEYYENGYTPNLDIVRGFDEVELMQSTGLKDKRGREVFEGDVVRGKYIEDYSIAKIGKYEIEYDGEHYDGFTLPAYGVFIENACGHKTEIITFRYAEVVGNIYENPELLEGR